MKLVVIALVALTFFNVAAAGAQTPPTISDIGKPTLQHAEIVLQVHGPTPANPSGETWAKVGDSLHVHNVRQPTLTPFLAKAGSSTGTAVIIAPGGAFMTLSIEDEGFKVAQYLADHGVNAFVLKYRLLPSPTKAQEMMRALVGVLTGDKSKYKDHLARGTALAVQDAQEAMRVVRARATQWGIDPHRIGFMGFSAGAYTTFGLVQKDDPDTMPDFVAPIYGSMDTPETKLPPRVPPMYALLAGDDPILGRTDFGIIPAWKASGGAVDFHLYDRGGHGFGFSGTPGTSTVHWPQEFLWWLDTRRLTGDRTEDGDRMRKRPSN